MKKLLPSLFILLLVVATAMAQNRTITGRVTSKDDGLPVPGVSVKVKGTSIGVSTNANGTFSISVPPKANALVITSVGFLSQTVSIGSESEVDIILLTDATSLGEVVITGYGTIHRRSFAGATANISTSEVAKQTFGSFDQALQGAAAGISVVASGGQPGQQAVVRIRGNGSINGSNTPLYILDGIEISAADFQTMNQGDFESIEVLKDAVSTGIYGSRGANGVIVMTTKKGKAGQVQFNYDFQLGRSRLPEDRLIVMNSEQKIDYEIANGNPYDWTAEQQAELKAVNFNWTDALFQTGKTQQHQISASAGTDKSKFYASLSYLDQEGIVQTTGLKRYTARVNIDNVVNNFKFGLGVHGGFSDRRNTDEGDTFIASPLNAIRWSNPYERAYLPDGSFNESGGVGTSTLTSGQPNAAMELFLNYNFNKQLKGIATSYLEYHIPNIKGLFLRTNWGIDYTQDEFADYTSPKTSTGIARKGNLSRRLIRNFRYTGTSSLNYATVVNKHEFSGGIFFEAIKNDVRSFGFTGYGLDNGFTNEAGITPGSITSENYIPLVSGSGSQYGLMSLFTSLTYGYNGKYYVNLIGRRDGSSRFGASNRWANFGSIGLTWSIGEEDFIKNLSSINMLKFRASYGTTGNNGVANYPILQFSRTSYSGVAGWIPSAPGNVNLTWETSETFNLGLDFGVFKNRINGTIEFYNKITNGQFYALPLDPSISGFTSVTSNFGRLRNRGVEFSIHGDIVKNKAITWTLGANISYNQNRIISLPKNDDIGDITILSEGSPINTLFLVPYLGVDPQTGEALYRKLDGSTTTVFSVADKIKYGTSDAPWLGGFSTRFLYKGFDLSAQVNFFLNRQMFNNDLTNLTNPAYYWDNMHISMLNEWRTVGQITDVPSAKSIFETETSRFIDNASFWRLRNITLGYTLPKSVMGALKIASARIFVQGQNLWTSTKHRSFDPETTGVSLVGAQYPSLRQFNIGLSIGF